MPHHKSATKRLRTAAKENVRNTAVKSALRRDIREFRAGDPGAKDLSAIYSALDTAARKGVIPKTRADRLKGRLARRV
jgi:small subunit ribosomal protein S20